ncbi:hypothetical protein SSX86_020636 [Deinandra increscens subsp. villosa]|uniref:non-specific serine/threonine protein kinase n=1 Tax=Deinandra increscens subsp. villosa TaxID=3103831 RepID=A0AAP0CTG6_9ASTR
MRALWICYSFALFLFFNCYSTPLNYPTANLSTTWSNTESISHSVDFNDGSRVRAILLRGLPRPDFEYYLNFPIYPNFACGFYCNGTCTSYLFAVFIVQTNNDEGFITASTYPQVVWAANRDHPVRYGAKLSLTATGELVLQDADGSTVWTTFTTGKSVAGLNLTNDGNLVLFDINNSEVWQSFDYPTDCLLLGQALFQGQQLIPSVSSTNWTAQKDLFSLQVTDNGFFGYVGSNPPKEYYRYPIVGKFTNAGRSYVRFLNGSLSLFIISLDPSDPDRQITIPRALLASAQYMKLMPDGHLRLFELRRNELRQPQWLMVADLFNGSLSGECNYPMACGRYGICSGNQQCSCPVSSSPTIDYFRAEDDRQPNLGCSEITPLTCNATQDQVFIELKNVVYFSFIPDMKNVDMATCKQACLKNCSCKAALFYSYGVYSLTGNCFLPYELLTMKNVNPYVPNCSNTSVFVKVQNVKPSPSSSKSQSTLGVMLSSIIGSAMFLLGAMGFFVYIIRKRRRATQMEEEYIGEVPGMPTRFSYEELKTATESFNKKLGEGGFGAVYEGTLEDGSKIVVKCLEGLGQVNKSFLAEVESIGSIHHVNLVRLRGLCAWKSQRFLVYEFMSHGSLDRWIYHGDRGQMLEWECKKKIILDVAKGLAYLHEEFKVLEGVTKVESRLDYNFTDPRLQKIAVEHEQDMTPLLASVLSGPSQDMQTRTLEVVEMIKVASWCLQYDFTKRPSMSTVVKVLEGVTKVESRLDYNFTDPRLQKIAVEHEQDMTPLLASVLSGPSFGIVLLETLCGRKNFDTSQPEESRHLLAVLQNCWEHEMLVHMVDKYSEDMQTRTLEVVEMIKVASWCLQYDFTKRPSMSTVVKVLEGVTKVESRLDYNFTDPRLQKIAVEHEQDMTPLLASVLSGPSQDMQTRTLEVVEMIKVASWCLQYDFTKRPSMSTVVKVLEGVTKVESRLDYNFTDPRLQKIAVEHEQDMTPLLASVLSGPSSSSSSSSTTWSSTYSSHNNNFTNRNVNLSTTWFNNDSIPYIVNSGDNSTARAIFIGGSIFAGGFYCNGSCTSYLFVVFMLQNTTSRGHKNQDVWYPQVVWSANRDHPVSDGAILNFTATGELVLIDADGSTVWTTNTTGKSVAGINLTVDGNLVLLDVNNSVVWQSFDYPTDCLLPGQKLFQGQQLIPSVSSTNWTAQKDLYSLQMTDKVKPINLHEKIVIPKALSYQYIKLMPDGHLKVFELQSSWSVKADLFTNYVEVGKRLGECDYPMACGRYGVCSGNQQCSCPVTSSSGIDYFKPKNDQQPNLGCSEITSLTCNATQNQDFIKLENVKYSSLFGDMESVNMETCKQACVKNCSCKAALFKYDSDPSIGVCFLPSELFTIMNDDPNITNASAFIKVQNVSSSPPSSSVPFGPSIPPVLSVPFGSKSRSNLGVITASIIASVMSLLGAIGFVVYIIHKRRRAAQMEEEYIDEVPGMPTRFSYEKLKTITDNFSKKLGEGGFGAVYEGTLEDCSKIAVKCLEGLGQVKKSFLAEVESIGSIHHVNLVRLRGFCAWKSQRFLVYEFMSNGSLERWIYHGGRERTMDWECRKKIVLDVAKGLAYLHEECRQKIIHLDIKPQNILLDSDFNAKVSDFGLSKLIDRNQTHVMITMRGTPGYMAPEWLSSVITEKVDVYSFGIVLLEMLCGRKNFDMSQPEESWHLLAVLQNSWEQGMLVDMVDKYSEDMQTRAPEVVEMIKVASWCLQYDFTKRPSMSTVVKVLEGVAKVESRLDYNFTDPRLQKIAVKHEKDTTPLLASVLSGPREVVTFYISELPPGCTSTFLWNCFKGIGKIVDAFVPRKLDWRNRAFGFVRYEGLKNVESALFKMRDIKVDGKSVRVYISKFQKDMLSNREKVERPQRGIKEINWGRGNGRDQAHGQTMAVGGKNGGHTEKC